jgi:hypothetical protein
MKLSNDAAPNTDIGTAQKALLRITGTRMWFKAGISQTSSILMQHLVFKYRVRQKDLQYLERALCELWWGYGGGGGIDR